jgi:hypothetical protein
MPSRSHALLGLLVAALLPSAAGAAGAAAKKLSAASPVRFHSIQALDCSNAPALVCGQSVDSTTVGLPDRRADYGCVPYVESGGEVVYRIDVTATTEVDIELGGLAADLDLFLLEGCDAGACAGASTGVSVERLRRCLAPGTYFVIVDGFAGAASPFRLSVACQPCAPCSPAVTHDTCDQAIAVPTHPPIFRHRGDTRCARDDYSDGTCTGYSSLGHDVAYRLSMPPGCRVQVTVRDGSDGIGLDLALYLATSCDDARGTCVAGADRNLTGEESFTYESATGGTYFLVVDSFGNGTSGDYELEIVQTNCSVVGVQDATWQQVKRLYRD